MNSERMKQFISLLLAGSMALGLLLPGVSAFAEDGDEPSPSEPSVAQTLVEKITEAAAAAAQNEAPPTPETPSQPNTPPQGDPEPVSESPGEPPAPHEGTDPEPDAPGVTEDPAQPEPPREEEPATPAPPEEEKPPEEPTPAEQKEKEQELEEARAHRSDPSADVEIPSEWAAMFEKLEFTGKYPDDLLAVARTQIGYAESEANYAETEDQRRGYTRYGAWSQDPYAPWNLTFAAFCLEYAQVPEDAFPREDDPETWRQTLTEQNLWTTEAPKPGDVAFLPEDPETAIEEETEAALVGIVDEIEEDGTLWVIAGDMENEVRRIELASDQIIGFGVLPPGEERQDPQPTDPASTDLPADNGEPPADYDAPQDPLDPADPAAPVGDLAGDLAQRIAEGLARTGGDPSQPPNGPAPPGEDGGSPDEPEEKPLDDLTGEDPVEPPEDLPEEPEGEPELPTEEELVEELPEELPFLQTQTLDGVTVTVTAEPGVFPDGAVLSVTKVPVAAQITVDAAVAPQRDGSNVALSYTFDVSILDDQGAPIQPADDQTVQVSFSMAQVADANLAPRVYHLAGEGEDLSARPLDVTTDGDTATVTTDGFSFYTVEFTYGDLQYVMEGDTTIPLDYILDYVGLTGEVTDVAVSDDSLFTAYQDDGVWYVEALEAFDTEEWMKVTIGGVVYEIVVTDSAPQEVTVDGIIQGGTEENFAAALPITRVYIDPTKLDEIDRNGETIFSSEYDWFQEVDFRDNYAKVTRAAAYTGKDIPGNETTPLGGSFTYTYPGAAILSDGTTKDVQFTFSNIKISTQTNFSSSDKYEGNVSIAAGRTLFVACDKVDYNWYFGLEVEVNIKVLGLDENQDMNFSMKGLNVLRNNQNYNTIYNAGSYYSYSEQLEIISRPTNPIYIPNKDIYETMVEEKDGHPWFVGRGGVNTSYTTGFVTTVNAKDGADFIFRAAAGYNTSGGYQKLDNFIYPSGGYFLLTSSTTAGGNIQTTSNGNLDGTLNDEGDVLKPGYYGVPRGKTMVYTMTPEEGYFLEYIEVDGYKVAPTSTERDENGKIMYYTYTFSNISADHVIHVSWGTSEVLPATGGMGLPLLMKLALGSMALTPVVSRIKRKWGVPA